MNDSWYQAIQSDASRHSIPPLAVSVKQPIAGGEEWGSKRGGSPLALAQRRGQGARLIAPKWPQMALVEEGAQMTERWLDAVPPAEQPALGPLLPDQKAHAIGENLCGPQ
jgi:hypothetical protein